MNQKRQLGVKIYYNNVYFPLYPKGQRNGDNITRMMTISIPCYQCARGEESNCGIAFCMYLQISFCVKKS